MKLRVYGPGQPYFPPPHRPPPKPGLSPLVIVLIVVGGVLVLGGGACVVLGALVALGASAEGDHPASSAASSGASGAAGATGVAPTVAPPATTAAAPSRVDDGSESDSDESPSPSPTATAKSAGASGNSGNGATWFCSASGSARVCGFAGACNYQMMFGNGMGTDRFSASQQAKNACEAQARARGASTVCVVQCTLK